MEKQLTTEEKARVFAMYWGSKANISFADDSPEGIDTNALCGSDIDGWVNDSDERAIRLYLRPLSDAKAEDIIGLLLSETPPDMEDAPEADDWDVDMFYNDGGTDVDADIAVGANIVCRCYVGQIALKHNGTILHYNEDGELQRPENTPAAFRYLLSKGFDLFGLIPAGLAIDSTLPA